MATEAPQHSPQEGNSGDAELPQGELVESGKRLSECIIWKLMESYYSNAGIDAWKEVPFYPTSNPFIADVYAEIIVHFLRDYASHLNRDEPIYVVEMAAGSGTLSFFLVRRLLEKQALFAATRDLNIRYVITDFTENNVSYWEKDPGFKDAMDRGVLDFAVFRPEDQDELHLRFSNTVLNAASVKNPVIGIANYFFDSISQDTYRITDHQLEQILVDVYRAPANAEEDETEKRVRQSAGMMVGNNPRPLLANDVSLHDTFRPTEADVYDDPHLNTVLKRYAEHYEKGSVIIPLGATRCVQNLLTLSNQNLVLISSDKGFGDKSYQNDHWQHGFTMHGKGAFSYMVNYDALKEYFCAMGGDMLVTDYKSGPLSSVVGFKLRSNDYTLENSRYFFDEKMEQQNLINNLYVVQDFVHTPSHEEKESMFQACIGLMHLVQYDPIALCVCGNKIVPNFGYVEEYVKQELKGIMARVRANCYSVRGGYDPYHWMGRVYYEIDEFDLCIEAFNTSVEYYGENDNALYHLAACYEVKGGSEQGLKPSLAFYEESLALYEKALSMDPSCELTKSGIERVKEKLG